MEDVKLYDAAARITAALIVAGHLPALNVKGIKESADMAGDLFDAVLKELNDSAVFSDVNR